MLQHVHQMAANYGYGRCYGRCKAYVTFCQILPNSARLQLAHLLLAPWRPFVDIYTRLSHCLSLFFLSFFLALDPYL